MKKIKTIQKKRFNFKKYFLIIFNKVIFITKKEFFEPIADEYVKSISKMSPEEIYDNVIIQVTFPFFRFKLFLRSNKSGWFC